MGSNSILELRIKHPVDRLNATRKIRQRIKASLNINGGKNSRILQNRFVFEKSCEIRKARNQFQFSILFCNMEKRYGTKFDSEI